MTLGIPGSPDTLARLGDAGWPLFLKPEEVWYRAGTSETGVRQFLV